jgi:thiosulfate/3-mercaptopyruvate sulfurtransferase
MDALVSTEWLATHLHDPDLRVLDGSWHMPAAKRDPRAEFVAAHIPRAAFFDIDAIADHTTPLPHMLPTPAAFEDAVGALGVGTGDRVVVYDTRGVVSAARVWWTFRVFGHDAVAVLDGGLQAWQAAGGEVTDREETAHFQSNFKLGPELRKLATTRDVEAALRKPSQTLVDARAAPRYRGEVEPLDPVAGHIPGAINRPFAQNFAADGRFKPPAQLRAEFEELLGGRDPGSVVHHCGSGVSALPNVIAMEVAGLGPTALYAGSWSEWCSDRKRPVEKG